MAGVIDADYRGHVQVLLSNMGKTNYSDSTSQRIAQLVVIPNPTLESKTTDTFNSTDCGSRGFGSTGTHDNYLTDRW